ncbi:tRNA (adenosine(37)-N6)-threonylcarbamoyltransferase complex dimerization subunit type 1 TsaB [Parasphingorhabdus pacifica]
MLVIALDTSTPAVTAGLVAWGDGGPCSLAERMTINPRAHGELLTPHLMEVLVEAGHRLAEVDAIVVGAGPGPFTGLRVGMVTAAALGHAHDVPVHPVCGLDALAVQTPGESPLLVATDARRKEVYWAAYGADRARLTGPHVQRPADVPDAIDGLGITTAAGEMAERCSEVLGLPPVATSYPTPVGLARAAEAVLFSAAAPEPLVPLYLRRPDAESPGPRKQVSAARSTS